MSTCYSSQSHEEIIIADTNIPNKKTHGCEEKDTLLSISHTNNKTKNEVWNQDWINRFSIEDSAQVVCDLENLMTVMLVEEVFMELASS